MPNMVVVGAQWGDEGKGKIIDELAAGVDFVVRFQGGANAGHTVVVGGEQYVFHLVPSGILRPHVRCVVGNGVVVDPFTLLEEVEGLEERGVVVEGRLFVAENAHVTLPHHKLLDAKGDERRGIGTTRRGIGPTYVDKFGRVGLRVVDLLDEGVLPELLARNLEEKRAVLGDQIPEVSGLLSQLRPVIERLRGWAEDTASMLNEAMDRGESVLFEGAQGTALDIDFGSYPFVTSSNPIAGGACVGAGVSPKRIDFVVGVAKAYTTRVGGGPFPTELPPEEEERLRMRGREYGATTGRPRRCGWFDAVVARHAARINGFDGLVITKLDVLDPVPELRICVAYEVDGERIVKFPYSLRTLERAKPVYETLPGWREDTSKARRWKDLPQNAKRYLERIAELVGAPLWLVSVGPERGQSVVVDMPAEIARGCGLAEG
ncbi:MAG TPA: adenylosuccinate synthase [Armatimonadetes bacterium]|nr:adenylosuccinate synthase [Armatimonadota bacterium]